MIALVVIALSFGVSVLIRFALSRSREYLADAGSVELTKNPDAMISALRKISANATIPAMPSRMQAFFIESPALLPESGWLATHPPIEDRIAALVEFAGGRDEPAPVSVEAPAVAVLPAAGGGAKLAGPAAGTVGVKPSLQPPGHDAGWYICSADSEATPSSVATVSTARWATARSTRPSEEKYGPM